MRKLPDDTQPTQLTRVLQQARGGDSAAEARLLELCRRYVEVHAQRQLHSGLAPRVDASDIVQETLLDAWQGLDRFRGTTSAELLAWLKQIVLRNALDAARQHAVAAKRCLGREVPLGSSSAADETGRLADVPSLDETPSQCAAKCEEELLLADAIAELPADYQQVLICRSLLRQPFAEVAERMNRSRPAVQMLWARAVEQLRIQLSARGVGHGRESTETIA